MVARVGKACNHCGSGSYTEQKEINPMNENKNTIEASLDPEVLNSTIEKMMDGLTTVAEARGIAREELEGLYQVGYTYYNAGKLAEAEKVFHFLCSLSHTTAKYWLALGSARQGLKNHKEALLAYAMAAILDPERPKAHYYAAECNLALGDCELAVSGVNSVLEMCPAGTPENDKFRLKAENLGKVAMAALAKRQA